jgi:hypothetical protein
MNEYNSMQRHYVGACVYIPVACSTMHVRNITLRARRYMTCCLEGMQVCAPGRADKGSLTVIEICNVLSGMLVRIT